jgi:hypothetical protein
VRWAVSPTKIRQALRTRRTTILMAWRDRASKAVLGVQLDNGRRRRRAQRDDRPPRRSLPTRPSGPPPHATSRVRGCPELPAAGGASVEGTGRDGSGPQRGQPTRRLLLSARAPTDRAMWRRLLARVHPDAGGDDELFVWAKSLEELVRAKAQDVPAPLSVAPSRGRAASHSTRTWTSTGSASAPYSSRLARIIHERSGGLRFARGKADEDPSKAAKSPHIDSDRSKSRSPYSSTKLGFVNNPG